MVTHLTIWHYLVLIIAILVLAIGIIIALRQKDKKTVSVIIFSFVIVDVLIALAAFASIDNYTKKVRLSNEEHFRILSLEKIIFTGEVKNVGNYTVGEVTYKVKIVNHKLNITKQEEASFFESKRLLDYFKPNSNLIFKPQTVEQEFVVAKNLQPGDTQAFRVDMGFPPYFESTSYITSVYGH